MKLVRYLLIALSAAALLAGCGSSDTTATTGVRNVTPQQAKDLIARNVTVIDVRSAQEFATGHVKGAMNLSVEADDFNQRLDALEADKPYVVYCRSGRRSAIAAALMQQAGFVDIADAGGFDGLKAAGVPTE